MSGPWSKAQHAKFRKTMREKKWKARLDKEVDKMVAPTYEEPKPMAVTIGEEFRRVNMRISELEEEVMKLGNKVTKIVPPTPPVPAVPTRWKPTSQQEYYFVDGAGAVVKDTWYSGAMERWDIGNVFKTKEDAEKSAAQRRVMQKLHDLALAAGRTTQSYAYYVGWCMFNKKWVSVSTKFRAPCTAFFPTNDSAEAAIKTLGAELDVLKPE